MKKFLKPVLALFVTASMLASCKEDEEPTPEDHEHELITTVTLSLVNVADTADVVTATFRDLDGPGGDVPAVEELELAENTTYAGTVRVLYEAEHDDHLDEEDLTEEIKAEGDDHELFFTPSSGLTLTVNKTDRDSQGRPIGLEAQFITGGPSEGTMNVKLMHQPGVKPTPGSANVGETDIDVTFDVHVH